MVNFRLRQVPADVLFEVLPRKHVRQLLDTILRRCHMHELYQHCQSIFQKYLGNLEIPPDNGDPIYDDAAYQ